MQWFVLILFLSPIIFTGLSFLSFALGPCSTRIVKQKRGWVIQDKWLFLFWSKRCKIVGIPPANCPEIFRLKDLFFNTHEEAQTYLNDKNHILLSGRSLTKKMTSIHMMK